MSTCPRTERCSSCLQSRPSDTPPKRQPLEAMAQAPPGGTYLLKRGLELAPQPLGVVRLPLGQPAERERRVGRPRRFMYRLVDVLTVDDPVLLVAKQILHRDASVDQRPCRFVVQGLEEFGGVAQAFGADPRPMKLLGGRG